MYVDKNIKLRRIKKMNEEIENCKFALNGKGIGRPCAKVEDRSCKYWGFRCYFEEKAEIKGMGRDSQVVWDEDDGYED